MKKALKDFIVKVSTRKSSPVKKKDCPFSFEDTSIDATRVYITDESFGARCSPKMRALSLRHWTSASVAREAARFLVSKSTHKVLDIGSGIGKFCVVGGAYTNGAFTGVEQRENLFDISVQIAKHYNLSNVQFIHSNITQVNFLNYDAFYFYNSFYENIEQSGAIDNSLKLDVELYKYYNQYIANQFAKLPIGTRIVTFCSDANIFDGYNLISSSRSGFLKFWEKATIPET